MKTNLDVSISPASIAIGAGVLAAAYVAWRGFAGLKEAARWVSDTAAAVVDKTVEVAKQGVEPLSVNKAIITKTDKPSDTRTPEEIQYQNDILNMWAMGNMGA